MKSLKATPKDSNLEFTIPDTYKQPLQAHVEGAIQSYLKDNELSGNNIRRFLQGLNIPQARLPGTFPDEIFNLSWNKWINEVFQQETTQKGNKIATFSSEGIKKFFGDLAKLGLLNQNVEVVKVVTLKIGGLLSIATS